MSVLSDRCSPLRKARSVNATTNGTFAKIPTITEPTGDAGTATGTAVHEVGAGMSPRRMIVIPYAVADADDVLIMRVFGWRRFGSGPKPGTVWIPTILASFTCTVGAATGVALSPLVATELLCDTIAILSEPTYTADTTRQGAVKVYSPTSDLIAWLEMDVEGVEKIEFGFDDSTNDPTSMNALFAFL